MFENRQQAGRLLAGKLKQLADQLNLKDAVVIGLPRGGVAVAAEVALAFDIPLDILVSKKIRAPDNPELAIGAVSSHGIVILDADILRMLGYPKSYKLAQEQQSEQLILETKSLEASWLAAAGIKQRPHIEGKTVILVDDGIATGSTALAAVKTVYQLGAKTVILATPVAPYDTVHKLSRQCDCFVSLLTPFDFGAVGFFYKDFHQVEDAEMVQALKRGNQSVGGVSLSGV